MLVPVDTIVPGSVPLSNCGDYDDIEYVLDFIPPTYYTGGGATQCTDQGPTWQYSIDQTPMSALMEKYKVTIDPYDNKIYLRGLIGGTLYGTFTLTFTARLPGSSDITTFDFKFSVSPCKNRPFTLPTWVTQLYYVTDPLSSYDPPAFITEPECDQNIVYTNQVSPNDWITGFTDNLG